MLALSDGVLVTLISTAGIVVVGMLTFAGVIFQARKTRGQMATGNGHTLGEGVARIEETLWRHENRLDGIEVELREAKEKVLEAKVEVKETRQHVEETRILARQGVQQMEDHLVEIKPLREWIEGKLAEENQAEE